MGSYLVDVTCDTCGKEVRDVHVTSGADVQVGEKLDDGLYDRQMCHHDTSENTIIAVRPND